MSIPVPFTRVVTDTAGNRSVETVHSVFVGSQADAAESNRPASPHNTTMAAVRVTVPISIVSNHIYLNGVFLNGRGPFRFVVDTGGGDIVTPQTARLVRSRPWHCPERSKYIANVSALMLFAAFCDDDGFATQNGRSRDAQSDMLAERLKRNPP